MIKIHGALPPWNQAIEYLNCAWTNDLAEAPPAGVEGVVIQRSNAHAEPQHETYLSARST